MGDILVRLPSSGSGGDRPPYVILSTFNGFRMVIFILQSLETMLEPLISWRCESWDRSKRASHSSIWFWGEAH
jgi:hypothetical protein